MAWLLSWLSWLLLTLVSLHLLTTARRRRRLPPGPWPLPVVGNLLELGDQPHRALARLAARHGPLMSLRLGATTTVVASSPAAAREVLQLHDAVLSARSVPDAVRSVHARSAVAWLPPRRQWRALRRLCAVELFTPQRLDALRPLRREMVQRLLRHVSALAAAGEPVDVGRVAFATILNLLSRTIFSVDLVGLERGESQEFKDVVAAIMEAAGRPNLSDFFPAVAAADVQGVRREAERCFARLHGVFDEQIERRRRRRAAGGAAMDDFLEEILDQERQLGEEGVELGQDTMRALFSDLFCAGSDTSSSTVEWAMAELLQSPRSMAKLRAELSTATHLDESHIADLPYLQAVVKETLRLHPPAPLLLPRRAEAAVEVGGGYTIPAGARVVVNAWAIGRDAAAWPDPEAFLPERFLRPGAPGFRGGDFELLPFGAGRRLCPGLPLAFRMVHLLLGSLMQRFEWTLPPEAGGGAGGGRGVDMTETLGVTLSMAVPLRAVAVET